MRVLYLSQYFPPEVGATQSRAHDMALGLVRAGYTVVVICEFPNHPGGRIPSDYRRKLYERDELDGIEVIRVWVKASPVKTFRTRIAFYSSYMIMAVMAGLCLVRGKYDLIYATSPPLFVGVAGMILSVLRGVPFVFEVRDLWPAVAVKLGELRNRTAIALASRLERSCCRRARCVVTVTPGCRRFLLKQGVPEDKLVLIPNGANTELFYPQPERGAELRRSLGLEGEFIVLYAGLHGIAQGMTILLEAAERLRDLDDLKLLLVGEGPVKAELIALAQARSIRNVIFHPEVSRTQMPAFFSMADISVAPLRKATLFQGSMSTKMFDAWACGCPVLAAGGDEARELMTRARAGLCFEPENSAALAKVLLGLRDDRDGCRKMGEAGRRYVTKHFRRDLQARLLATTLRDLLATNDESSRRT